MSAWSTGGGLLLVVTGADVDDSGENPRGSEMDGVAASERLISSSLDSSADCKKTNETCHRMVAISINMTKCVQLISGQGKGDIDKDENR